MASIELPNGTKLTEFSETLPEIIVAEFKDGHKLLYMADSSNWMTIDSVVERFGSLPQLTLEDLTKMRKELEE